MISTFHRDFQQERANFSIVYLVLFVKGKGKEKRLHLPRVHSRECSVGLKITYVKKHYMDQPIYEADLRADRRKDGLIRWLVIWEASESIQIRLFTKQNDETDQDELTAILNRTNASLYASENNSQGGRCIGKLMG